MNHVKLISKCINPRILFSKSNNIGVLRYPFGSKQEISEPDWEVYLRETGQKMVTEQSPRALMEVRSRLYELLTHCISPELIIKVNSLIIILSHASSFYFNIFLSFP